MHIFFYLFLLLRHALCTTGLNHWVLENDLIIPKPETSFLLREPDNFISFIKQIQNSEFVENSFIQLLQQREKIAENIQFSVQFGNTVIEQAKCAMEYLLLEKRSSYLKISSEYLERIGIPKLKMHKINYQSRIEDPLCEEKSFYKCFSSIGSIRQDSDLIKRMEIIEKISLVPERNVTFGEIPMNSDTLRRQARELLKEDPQSWKSYLIASYYWRNRGNAKFAFACGCQALIKNSDMQDIPLLNLGIILFRCGLVEYAEQIVLAAVAAAKNVAVNHLTLGAILALKHDFNRSLLHLDEAERIDASLLPKTVLLRKFVSCFDNLGKKTLTMNNYVEYIKNEVREFKNLKQQIKRRHEALMNHQVPLSARHLSDFQANNDILRRGQYCSKRILSSSEEPVLYCDFYTEIQMRLESNEVDISTLEQEMKASSESLLKQVTKELGKEIGFHDILMEKDEKINESENKKNSKEF